MTCVLLVVVGLWTSAGRGDTDLRDLEEAAFRAAVAHVAPSVIRLETLGAGGGAGELAISDGPTTALVVSKDGYVLASAFPFLQKPATILAILPNGERTTARVVAHDHSRMLALLKVRTEQQLPVPEPVPLDEMRVGQWAVAVGRTFEPHRPNMSVGIVSALDRIWGKAIQTDAKVSPNNYGGPLVDLRGRVLGILTPLSPHPQDRVAGTEWYDSGIGFAVPLADIMPRLEQLKRGEDLHAGLVGVSLKGDDPLHSPVEIVACPPRSPARQAGLAAGDRIVEVNGRPIERQAHFRHALARHYAGETITLVALRGEQRLEKQLTLVAELIPFEFPALGILPLRPPVAPPPVNGEARGQAAADPKPEGTSDNPPPADEGKQPAGKGEPGVGVRFVYGDSAAAKAGLAVGDRIRSVGGEPATDAAALRGLLANREPGAEVEVQIERQGEFKNLRLVLGTLPTEVPAELPPAFPSSAGAAEQAAAGAGLVTLKLPEFDNECFAYIPKSYRAEVPTGLLLFLHEPGGYDRDAIAERWSPLCDQYGFILVAPRAGDPKAWQSTELEVIRKFVDQVLAKYSVDRTRVAVHGYKAGAAMAYLVALSQRDLIRGVAAVDGPLPARVRIQDNDPAYPLLIYSAVAEESDVQKQVAAGLERFRQQKFPVLEKVLAGPSRYLNAGELAELARWVDSLDRL